MHYVRWTPEVADGDADLKTLVEDFEPIGLDAGQGAARWLKERSLSQHRAVSSWLLVETRVEGFVAVRMSEVQLHLQQQEELAKDHASQGAILIAWLARHKDSSVGLDAFLSFIDLLAQRIVRDVGAIAVAVDPFDSATEKIWRKVGFRSTRTQVGSREEPKKRLWSPIPDLKNGS